METDTMARMKYAYPARKVLGSSLAVALTTLLLVGLDSYVLDDPLGCGATGAILALVALAAGYVTRPAPHDQVIPEDEPVHRFSGLVAS